ncbi:MAG: PhoH family protein, partial [Muribaculaceae bacterium]|nr:PhoH family protein [Muribaculaceae bacterium]
VLKDVKGIGKVEFGKKDIIRHALVQKIVEAYEKFEDHELSMSDTPVSNEADHASAESAKSSGNKNSEKE